MGKSKATAPATKGRGGARSKAGRPRSEVIKARDDLDIVITDLVRPKVSKVVAALLDLALGVKEKVDGPDGKPRLVYTTPPDFRAAIYLLDRVAGKPKQAMEIAGVGGMDIRTAATLTEQKATEYRDPDDEPGDGDPASGTGPMPIGQQPNQPVQ